MKAHIRPIRMAFTLIELLVVISIISVLAAFLLPVLARAKEKGQEAYYFSNLRQIALAARLYMSDYNGGLFHHHEGWVLDDGSQVDTLPSDLLGVVGGGMGNSQAEKPWILFFQPEGSKKSCSLPVIKFKQPSQSLARSDLPGRFTDPVRRRRKQDHIPLPLMVSFGVIMLSII
jgi:prepilin-type N-terminal cleavage/methylation domain-containing protein